MFVDILEAISTSAGGEICVDATAQILVTSMQIDDEKMLIPDISNISNAKFSPTLPLGCLPITAARVSRT